MLGPNNDFGQPFNQVDIITSGGYKIYSIASSRMLHNSKYRIIYQHEQSNEVIIQQSNSYKIGRSELFIHLPG